MQSVYEERVRSIGSYIAESGVTIRNAAQKFKVSKSTVHKDVTERLKKLDLNLYSRVRTILEINKAQRHIRGGNATRMKYKLER